jgi:hypothetical protein
VVWFGWFRSGLEVSTIGQQASAMAVAKAQALISGNALVVFRWVTWFLGFSPLCGIYGSSGSGEFRVYCTQDGLLMRIAHGRRIWGKEVNGLISFLN